MRFIIGALITATFVILFSLVLTGNPAAMYLTDGTKEVSPGVYENPNDGMCIVGVAANGDMLIDTSITNARDCVAYTTGLTGMTTSAACITAGGAGNDGYRHTWSTSNTCINAANPSVAISLEGLDRTLAMCQSKGGTTLTSTGTCVAYGWQYRNRKADGTVPVVANTPATTKGVVAADNLGFCYAPVRMTTPGTFDALTCPSINNLPKYCNAGTQIGLACTNDATCTGGGAGSCVRNTTDWPDCASNNPSPASTSIGCQTPEAYSDGLGWSYASGQCIYAYGVDGFANATITRANGTTYVAGAAIVPASYTTQGDCLSQGFTWDNWLPVTATTLITDIPTTLGATDIRKFNTTTPVASGGGQFHSGTGAVCTKCHTDQSRAYMERNKPAYIQTGHKSAADNPLKPWTTNFTEANSAWGIKGVQCNICHGTARPGQADLLQVSTGTSPAPAGTAKYASGHQNLALGTAATQLCFECHGTATTPETDNPALVIPVSAGEFSNTSMGLAPIANQFLNSPHAKYTGNSVPLSLTTKANYGTTFVGYNCRTAANGTSYLTTVYQTGEVGLIHFLDSITNPDCTNAGNGSATSGAAGFWQREGSNTDSATANRTDAGNCTTCHDVHWSLDSTAEHAEPLRRECTTCHVDPGSQLASASSARQIVIANIVHPTVPGSPVGIATASGKPNESCEICHMPKLTADGQFVHLWRISTDASYVTAGATGVNLDVNGKAWVDLGSACGQCHKSGGAGPAFTAAQMAAAAPAIHSSQADMNCFGCHNTAQGTYAAIAQGTNHHYGSCITCHYPGAPNGRAPHDETVPSTTNAACLACHNTEQGTFIAISMDTMKYHSTTGTPTTCVTCHLNSGVAPDIQSTCGQCHGGGTDQISNPPTGSAPYITLSGLNNIAPDIHGALGTRLPDLLVSSISVPSSSVAGGGVTVTDTVISLGVTSAVASTNYYYLSTKPYYDDSAISLGSRSVGALAVGATDSGSASVTIPVGTAVGNYYIIAKADGADLIRELYETNNTRSGAIKIGVADLTVSTVTVSSTISGAGSLLGVGDTTQNIGSGTAVASTTKYYLSKNGVYDAGDVYLGERTVPSLAGGASDTSGTTVTIPIGTVSGNWNIVAVADADNAVVETYKTNNSSFRAIKIGPDLTVSAVTAPATAANGSSITVGDTTQNSGIGSAGASTTRYYLSTNGTAARAVATLANRAVPSLGAGVTSTTTTSVTIPLSTVPGKYYIVVEADAAGAVPEIYETNNTMFRQITIQ